MPRRLLVTADRSSRRTRSDANINLIK